MSAVFRPQAENHLAFFIDKQVNLSLLTLSMDKKYQVFVSSTYEDLREERQKVIEAVLGCDCFPVGMEYFPAGDESQWDVIKQFISECDYYIVIVAGKYGSVDTDGKSYTQKEYEFAVETGVPVMAFLHGEPGKIANEKSEDDSDNKKKLKAFRELCKKRMCKDWVTPDGLAGQIAMSLNSIKKSHQRIGWIRGNKVPANVTERILRMSGRLEELENHLKKMRTEPPPGIEEIAQQDEKIMLNFIYTYSIGAGQNFGRDKIELTWNQIFKFIAPDMLIPRDEHYINNLIGNLIQELTVDTIQKQNPEAEYIRDFKCTVDDFNTVKIQFRSLGLIERDPVATACWILTPYGDQVMTKLRAIRTKKK